MGFFSFLGRVLFASLFILSAWQMFHEFDEDGGPALKELLPKLALAKKHITSKLGVDVPDFDASHLVAFTISLKGVGGILFVFGSQFGAYLLILYLLSTSPILYDFYNYDRDDREHFILQNEFLQSVALLGALLFFIGMKNLIPRRQLKKKTNKVKVGYTSPRSNGEG